MTFTARPIAPFRVDILSADNPSSFTAGAQIPCTGSPINTGASVSSGAITLPAGSNWRVEYSATFTGDGDGYTQFNIGFYSTTDGGYVGQSCWGTTPTQNQSRKGRVVATALILNSDISTSSKTIEARIISQVDMTASAYLSLGIPTFRIMELPA